MGNKTKTTNVTFRQQGDVLIRHANIPENAVATDKTNRAVLAHGESGHSHVAVGDDLEIYAVDGIDVMYLAAPNGAVVQHEEHGTIVLEPGTYEVGRVLEYDHFAEEARRVVD